MIPHPRLTLSGELIDTRYRSSTKMYFRCTHTRMSQRRSSICGPHGERGNFLCTRIFPGIISSRHSLMLIHSLPQAQRPNTRCVRGNISVRFSATHSIALQHTTDSERRSRHVPGFIDVSHACVPDIQHRFWDCSSIGCGCFESQRRVILRP